MAEAKAFDIAEHLRLEKPRALGTMTLVAIVFAIAVVGSALALTARSISRPKSATGAAPAPWYPEPSFLLKHRSDLKLTDEQFRHVQVASRVWGMQKAAFDERFETVGKDSAQALNDLQSQKPLKGTYAQIVADFDKARFKAWTDASSTLKGDQVLAIDQLRSGKPVSMATPQEDGPSNASLNAFGKNLDRSQTDEDLDKRIAQVQSQIARAKRHRKQSRLALLNEELEMLQAKKAAVSKYGDVIGAVPGKPLGLQFIPLTPIKIAPQLIPLAKPRQSKPIPIQK